MTSTRPGWDNQFAETEEERNARLALRRELRKTAPYREWCMDPELCAGKGYCPRDPNCGD